MIVLGLSHKTAPIAVRERVAVPKGEVEEVLSTLRSLPGVREAAVLSTCNRMELYAAAHEGHDEAQVERTLLSYVAERGGRDVVPHLSVRRGPEAVHHLFRVASSLDSLVVGEPQILGQLKDAIKKAEASRSLGPELQMAMRGAVKVAKRVRSQTSIGSGQVSVPSVAVDLARQIFDELQGQSALMVGAGEMAESAAKLLARAGSHITVVNRSPARAEKLATVVGGYPRPWDELDTCLIEADIVIASTSAPHPIITKKQLKRLRRKRRGRSLFVIDIALPRDVDPNVDDLDFVYLYDIDDLSHVVAQHLEGRRAEADRAEAIVRRQAALYEERRTQQSMKPVIVALRERAKTTLDKELARSYRKQLKHLSDDDKQALSVMVEAAVNKLLHAPTRNLKQLASSPRSDEAAELVCHLFELEEVLDGDEDDAPNSDGTSARGDANEDGTSPQRVPR